MEFLKSGLEFIAIGTGGKVVSQTIEGREKYEIEVRFSEIKDLKLQK